MPRNSGFTLLELLVAVTLSLSLFLAVLALFQTFQVNTYNLELALERDENLWLAPLLLSRWVSPAGNNRWEESWEGFSTESGELRVNTDIDGPDGFPDGQLASSFEAIAVRGAATGLQLKSGKGSFQTLLKNISLLQLENQDLPLMRLRISARTERPLLNLNESLSSSTLAGFYLWNYRRNLFAEAP